jgi:thiol-disulfide isomerase/thioredoxin
MGKVRIEVFGSQPPCAKCRATIKLAEELAKEFSGEVEVKEYTAFSKEADKYNIMMTPTVVINGKVFTTGKVPSRDELLHTVKRELRGE